MREHKYYVYILTNPSQHPLYTGVTNDIYRRVLQHRDQTQGYTAQYHLTRLVHYEEFQDVHHAIAREKEIKGWSRAKKRALIDRYNPQWNDLARDWGKPIENLGTSLRSV